MRVYPRGDGGILPRPGAPSPGRHPFRAGIFTNLTQDHLDFHGTMEAYRDAKGALFRQCASRGAQPGRRGGPVLCRNGAGSDLYLLGVPGRGGSTSKNLRLFPQRVEFEAVTRDAISRVRPALYPEAFYHLQRSGCAGLRAGAGPAAGRLCPPLGGGPGVKGRIEVVPTPRTTLVLIDYAHTPDALENILTTVRDFTPGPGDLPVRLRGRPGPTKRPVWGAVAGALADVAGSHLRQSPVLRCPWTLSTTFCPAWRGLRRGRGGSPTVAPPSGGPSRWPGQGTRWLAGKGHVDLSGGGRRGVPPDEREEIAAYFA